MGRGAVDINATGISLMGLAVRIIPTILSRNGQLVKGKRFASDRVVGAALQASLIHNSRGVDELCILDVTATPEKREPDYALVEKLTDDVFSPITYGGGVRSIDHVRRLLKAGADKVCVGTGACEVPELVENVADEFGSQAVVVSMDVGFERTVMIACGKSPWTADIRYYADWIQRAGAGEILLQSIDRDGTLEGYDLELIREVCQAVSIPVIASGGCNGYEDMLKAIEAGASAVGAGALFQFTDATPKAAAQYLASKGVEVRL